MEIFTTFFSDYFASSTVNGYVTTLVNFWKPALVVVIVIALFLALLGLSWRAVVWLAHGISNLGSERKMDHWRENARQHIHDNDQNIADYNLWKKSKNL